MVAEKGFKMTEVGLIPNQWKVLSLEEVACYRRGSFPQPYGLKKWYDDLRGTPFVQVFDIGKDLKINSETKRRISLAAQKYSVFAPKGTILITIQGSIGRVAITQYDSFVDRTLLLFEGFKREIDKYYFSIVIQELFAREKLSAPGEIIKTITKETLSKFTIALPPLPEQAAIAEVLSDMDALIAQTERVIEKKKAIKQGVMQELLRPKEGWVTRRLGDVCQFAGGGTPSRTNQSFWNGSIPWVTIKDLSDFNPNGSQEYITAQGLRYSSSRLIPSGTLILVTRMAVGKAVLYNIDVAINQDLKALFPSAGISSKFLYYWFQNNINEVIGMSGGSTVLGLSVADLRNLTIPFPALKEQIEIVDILNILDEETDIYETLLNKRIEFKKGMMQSLLTGRIRLV